MNKAITIAVDRAPRRMGIGLALIEDMKARLRARSIERLCTIYGAFSAPSAALMRKAELEPFNVIAEGSTEAPTVVTARSTTAPEPKRPDVSPPCIETERLIVRPPQPGDGVAHYRAVQGSLPNLRRFPASLPWALEEPSEEGSEGYCQHAAEEFRAGRDFPLLFVLRGTGEITGASGLHNPDWSVPALEIGWWGRTCYLGQGLITEGAGTVLQWGFAALGARRIHATVDEENAASLRLCERIGMEMEGRLRHARADPDGQLRNLCLYAAIR